MDDTTEWPRDGGRRLGYDPGSSLDRVETRDSLERGGFAEAHAAERNRLLRALPLDAYAWLLPRLSPVRLGLRHVLVEPNVPIRDVYFLREGVASVIADEQEGGSVEVGTVGPEGIVGLPVLHGADTMPYRVFMQIAGEGWRLCASTLTRLLDESPAVRKIFLRYAQYVTDELSQSVACNRLHTLDERCARWLLMTLDRVHGERFELTHEFLSLMLGVRRAGVTVAMGRLQHAGILHYARGQVTIVDRGRLEEASCGCYALTRAALARLVG